MFKAAFSPAGVFLAQREPFYCGTAAAAATYVIEAAQY